MTAWSQETLSVLGADIFVERIGEGPPLLVLHHDIGLPEKRDFYERLADRFEVVAPHHPGWGKSERPLWMRSVRDLAVVYQQLVAQLALSDYALVGMGFGGWIAAEMATMAPRDLRKLVLVAPMGVRPREGYILDQAILSYIAYVKAGLNEPAAFERIWGAEPPLEVLVQWDVHREMCFRIAWKPYMYSQTLPHLLPGVRAPALVLCGDNDRIVPRSSAEIYAAALPDAKLEVLASCGHFAELERPRELAERIRTFVGQ